MIPASIDEEFLQATTQFVSMRFFDFCCPSAEARIVTRPVGGGVGPGSAGLRIGPV